MKLFKFVLVATLLLSFAAQAADTYYCKQRLDNFSVDPAIGRLSVTIKPLKVLPNATKYGGETVDQVEIVQVEVKATRNGKTTVIKRVRALAATADVMFWINNNGINFSLYLDELDESDISFKLGEKKVSASLTCN